jgi:hypothetical protein
MAENLYTEQMIKEERSTETATTTALNYAPVVRTEILNVPQAVMDTSVDGVKMLTTGTGTFHSFMSEKVKY